MTRDKHLNKVLLLLVLIMLQIVVLNAKDFDFYKIKTKHFLNELTAVKIMFKNDMSTKSEAKRKNITQNHIKSIRFFDGENLVYHATLTPYLSRNPMLKFKYSGETSSIGILETVDNHNKLIRGRSVIKKPTGTKEVLALNKVQENKQSLKIASSAIQKEFGTRNFIRSKNIRIVAPDITPNPNAVLIKIQSNIKAKSVTLFATESASKASYFDIKNSTIIFDNNDLTLVYKMFVQERTIIDVGVKIKLSYGENSKVLVVIEAEDGKLYMAEKPIIISICIDAGG